MKKQILAALLFGALATQIPAQAAGGFQGPGAAQVVSTAQLKSLPDDAYAIIPEFYSLRLHKIPGSSV